jgi:hypothetical protein
MVTTITSDPFATGRDPPAARAGAAASHDVPRRHTIRAARVTTIRDPKAISTRLHG